MNPKWIAISVLALLLSSDVRAESLFINDATVHSMDNRPVLLETDLLLRDGRVRSLGPNLEAPADARVIEARGRPVTPGFFAGITALGLVEITLSETTVDNALELERMRPEFDVTRAFNPHSSLIPVTRLEGYTWGVLGADLSGSIIGGQGRAVLLDGNFQAFLGDPLLFIDVGADASAQSAGSRAAQWMLLEQAMAESGDEIRWAPETLLTPAGREALAGFKSAGTVIFHADRASDMVQVLKFAEKHGLATVISGGAEAWMIADRLAEAGIPVLLNPLSNLPGNFDQLGARLDNAAILHEAGVTIAFAGARIHNARKLRQLAGNAVSNGLPYEAGLAAMTVNPARIFGLDERRGTIAEGGPADLVIWSGDPLEVTSAADQVILHGKAIDMVSRQTLLRDRYLPREPERPRAYIVPE